MIPSLPTLFSRTRTVLSTACLAAFLISPTANAAFVMMLEDIENGGSATIYDGSGNDLNGVNGTITFSGVVGAFTINVTTGVSKPSIGPGRLDLNSINVSSGEGGTLVVRISDTDFNGPATLDYNAAYGGTTDQEVAFNFYHDPLNNELGGNNFASGGFISSGSEDTAFAGNLSGAISAASPYALTIEAIITHGSGNLATSFNAGVSPGAEVPIPAAAWLFGSALLAMAATKAREK